MAEDKRNTYFKNSIAYFVVFSIFFGIVVYHEYKIYRCKYVMPSWPTASGILKEARVKSSKNGSNIKAVYDYKIGDALYTSRSYSYMTMIFSSYLNAQRELSYLESKNEIEVRYNPENYQESYLNISVGGVEESWKYTLFKAMCTVLFFLFITFSTLTIKA